MFSNNYLLWAIAVALVAVLFVLFRLHSKTAKPFELFTEVAGFISTIRTRVEAIITEVKGISKYLSDLSFRISGISDTTAAAAQAQLTVDHIETIVRKILQEELSKLTGATDGQTEKLFNGLDLQTKVIVTQIEKVMKEKLQTWLTENPVAAEAVSVAEKVLEPVVEEKSSNRKSIAKPAPGAAPQVDLTQGGQIGYVADKKA